MKFTLTTLIQAANTIGGFPRDISDPVWDDGMGGGHLRKQGINLEIDN